MLSYCVKCLDGWVVSASNLGSQDPMFESSCRQNLAHDCMVLSSCTEYHPSIVQICFIVETLGCGNTNRKLVANSFPLIVNPIASSLSILFKNILFSEGALYAGKKQAVRKVVSFVKNGGKIPSLSLSVMFI